MIAFLSHVEDLAGEPSRFLHLGLTSSDVLDAALAVQLQEAGQEILAGVDELLSACKKQAEAHRGTHLIGRSHGIHAEPVTAGLVFAGFFAEVVRARRAIEDALAEVAVGKIAGAVGAYANLDPAIESRALAALGLRPETVPTQVVARDRHAAFFASLARLGTAVERIAVTVRHWQRTEVREAFEAFGKGQKGSSAMPHKKNPILSENLCRLARRLRGYADTAYENVALWHKRDISHSSVERVIGPDATGLADFMVRRAATLVGGLIVDTVRMTENLNLTGGLYFSEAVLLALVGTGMTRQPAYELVQKHALAAFAERAGPSFRDRLAGDPEVTARLPVDQIDRAFDLQHHLRHVDSIIDRALKTEGS